MQHLTVDQILDFVSMTELNSESIKLSATVNGHIRQCEKCLELVRAFQMIYDEFSRLDTTGSFRGFVTENILKQQNEKTAQAPAVLEELEGFM